tara:strand:- start:2589 stop:2939 length:351 start_codon:yes stop_codon:yes gene_type:complete
MASQNENGFKSFLASGAISAYRIVKVQSDGTITAAADDTKGIGVTQEDVADAGYASVKLWSAPGSFMVAASGSAITAATSYGTITGGFAGVVTTARFTALNSAVASNGIVVELVQV